MELNELLPFWLPLPTSSPTALLMHPAYAAPLPGTPDSTLHFAAAAAAAPRKIFACQLGEADFTVAVEQTPATAKLYAPENALLPPELTLAIAEVVLAPLLQGLAQLAKQEVSLAGMLPAEPKEALAFQNVLADGTVRFAGTLALTEPLRAALDQWAFLKPDAPSLQAVCVEASAQLLALPEAEVPATALTAGQSILFPELNPASPALPVKVFVANNRLVIDGHFHPDARQLTLDSIGPATSPAAGQVPLWAPMLPFSWASLRELLSKPPLKLALPLDGELFLGGSAGRLCSVGIQPALQISGPSGVSR